MTVAYHATKVLLLNDVQEGYVLVKNDTFAGFSVECPADVEVVECSDSWIVPGFVDTHIHGFFNHDVMDLDPEGINIARKELAKRGTTSWLATTLTASVEQTQQACSAVAKAIEIEEEGFLGCRTQGIFLEGPFFTEKHKGAQNPAYMFDPSLEVFDQWQESSGGLIKKSALAAEREGSSAYAQNLSSDGVVCAIGHSNATYDEGLDVVNAGASVFVHTYNGMSGLHHREPGLVGLAMTTDNTYAEIICDGMHVHPAAVEALVRAKGWDHTFLVSDCLRCGGMPEGEYVLGEFPIVLSGGVCRLRDADSIAGSVVTMQIAAQNVYKWNIVTAEQALRMATEIPAKANNIDDACGYIKPGRFADFCVLDNDLNLTTTYLGGVEVPQ